MWLEPEPQLLKQDFDQIPSGDGESWGSKISSEGTFNVLRVFAYNAEEWQARFKKPK